MYWIDFSALFLFFMSFFLVSLFCVFFTRRHVILVLIFLDILLLTSILMLVVYSLSSEQTVGYNYALLLLGVAAADTAVGLGLFMLFYKTKRVTGFIPKKYP
jgi:NADH:ubiquinone oxidoreductase subunit K